MESKQSKWISLADQLPPIEQWLEFKRKGESWVVCRTLAVDLDVQQWVDDMPYTHWRYSREKI